jgi:hypothetical protein
LDNLIAASKIPNGRCADRQSFARDAHRGLTPNPKFADFLAKELIRWIRTHYNATNDPGGTMQRVLSAASKDKKPSFSKNGLAIPERDKLKMKIDNRQKVVFSWGQMTRIVEHI